DNFYVLTAHHCIYGDNNKYPDIQIHQIILQRQCAFNAPFEDVELLEITESDFEEDWVVLKVKFEDKDNKHPIVAASVKFRRNDELLFTGFQFINKNESRSFKS